MNECLFKHKITLNVLYCVQKYKINKIYKKYKSVENNKFLLINNNTLVIVGTLRIP